MKKNTVALIIIAVIIFAAGVFRVRTNIRQAATGKPHPSATPKEVTGDNKQGVSVTLDFGDAITTASGIRATTAYEALTKALREKNIPITTKQYDFGVFIESIGNKKNTNELSWIYHINSVSATQSADSQRVSEGDSVEWKYMKPTQ